MAQKAVRSEASSPNSLGPERDWPEVRGEECRTWTVLSWLLAKWFVGKSEEAGRRTLSSHGPENPEEKKIALSLRRWEQKQNETEDSPPGGRSGVVLAVSWERANSNISGLPASGPLCRLPGRLGAWLGRGGRRSPARGSTHRPMCRFGLGRSSSRGRRRVPTATGRLRPGPGGSGMSTGAGCAGSPRSAAVPPRTAGRSPRRFRRTALPGRWGVEKVCLVDVLHLCQAESEMALLDHHGGHRLPEGPRRDYRRL